MFIYLIHYTCIYIPQKKMQKLSPTKVGIHYFSIFLGLTMYCVYITDREMETERYVGVHCQCVIRFQETPEMYHKCGSCIFSLSFSEFSQNHSW